MKKLLLVCTVLSFGVMACGPSEEEKAKLQEAYQQEVDRKVDEIMQKLEPAQPSVQLEADSVNSDTLATDSLTSLVN